MDFKLKMKVLCMYSVKWNITPTMKIYGIEGMRFNALCKYNITYKVTS